MTLTHMTKAPPQRRAAAASGTRLRFDRGRFSVAQADALDEKPATILFGLPLVNATLEEAAEAIVARAARGDRAIIHFINAHCINTLRTDPAYGLALSHADALLPDGSGLSIAALLSGRALGENLNGTDLFPWLCREAAAQDVPVFLLGGQPGIARKTATAMQAQVPGLTIAGAHHGYLDRQADEDLIAAINSSGAGILLVGMGVPAQEKWIARHRDRITVPVLLGVGGLFDYYSGSIPRAPKALRTIGMEWMWRLAQEPRRLARRYLLGNAAFLARAAVQAWHDRGKAEHYAAASKRSLDLGIALLALILLGPLFAALCVFIMLDDRGPVFFSQTRIGADGKPFRMLKFRSMAVDAEARLAAIKTQSERDGVCFKMKRDPRITRVGRWLRRLSLDELPQLFNVVKGDMSIVGPRPALPVEVLAYDDDVRGRLRGAPGLTCTWQVSGRAEIPFEEQARLDIDYLESRSLVTDMKLILKTVPAVISGRGAY
jgi:exopolysaccharide biosynthesis WecB/TagA/CpsF family protein